jgi:hypothetical protein
MNLKKKILLEVDIINDSKEQKFRYQEDARIQITRDSMNLII